MKSVGYYECASSQWDILWFMPQLETPWKERRASEKARSLRAIAAILYERLCQRDRTEGRESRRSAELVRVRVRSSWTWVSFRDSIYLLATNQEQFVKVWRLYSLYLLKPERWGMSRLACPSEGISSSCVSVQARVSRLVYYPHSDLLQWPIVQKRRLR